MQNTSDQSGPKNQKSASSLMETLGMKLEESGADRLVLSMEVGPSLHQPYGLLHGGASAALAETAGSMLSAMQIDMQREVTLGISLECHHLGGVRSGKVTAEATFVHKGRTTHLTDILLKDNNGKQICSCRLTTIVMPKKSISTPNS